MNWKETIDKLMAELLTTTNHSSPEAQLEAMGLALAVIDDAHDELVTRMEQLQEDTCI